MRLFFLVGCVFLLLKPALSQQPLSLEKAIQLALEQGYSLEIARQNIAIANNNNNWGTAGRYPRLDLNVNAPNGFTYSRNPGFLIEQSNLNTGITPSVDASWVIYNGNRVNITKRQLEEISNQNYNQLNIAIENTVQTVISAYNAVLIQEEQLNTLQEVLALSRDRIRYQEVQKEFGQAGKFDLLQTQDAYLNDSTSLLIQKNNLDIAYRNLNLAMGEDDLSQQWRLTDRLDFDIKDYDLNTLEQQMFANNPTLQNLFTARELANINTQLQESFQKPVVSIGSGLSYNLNASNGKQTIAFGGQDPIENEIGGTGQAFNYYLNVSATYNLFDGGVNKRNVENARTEALIAQLNINDLKRNLSTQLQNTFANYQHQLELVELTDNLINNARQNLQIAEERFRGGLINSFDFRSIQLAYASASQARLNAIFNLKNTEAALMALTGELVKLAN